MLHSLDERCFIVFIVCGVLLILYYLLTGLIIKYRGCSLVCFLRLEEYTIAVLASIGVFLIFSLPTAIIIWIVIYFFMNILFAGNRRIRSYATYCEQNKEKLTHHQLKLSSRLKSDIKFSQTIMWAKVFFVERKEVLNILNREQLVKKTELKFRLLPFTLFAVGTIGVDISLLIYGGLIDKHRLIPLILLENYTILASALFVLYPVLYFATIGNPFHYLYSHKRLFQCGFISFALILFIAVTVISFNE